MCRMSQRKTLRIIIPVSPETVSELDDYRFAKRAASRSEVVREAIALLLAKWKRAKSREAAK